MPIIELLHAAHTAYEIYGAASKEFNRSNMRSQCYSYCTVKGIELMCDAVEASESDVVDVPSFEWITVTCDDCKIAMLLRCSSFGGHGGIGHLVICVAMDKYCKMTYCKKKYWFDKSDHYAYYYCTGCGTYTKMLLRLMNAQCHDLTETDWPVKHLGANIKCNINALKFPKWDATYGDYARSVYKW